MTQTWIGKPQNDLGDLEIRVTITVPPGFEHPDDSGTREWRDYMLARLKRMQWDLEGTSKVTSREAGWFMGYYLALHDLVDPSNRGNP